MKTLKELKTQREETLAKFRVNFRFLMGLVESFSPLLIQAIPAALTIVSISNIFPSLLHISQELAWVIAWLVGLGMEALGMVSVDVYFESKSFNQTRKEGTEKAPENAALTVMLIYAVTALLIVVFLKMFPVLAIWSLIPLTLMSILIVSAATMKKRLDDLIAQNENVQNEIEQTQLVQFNELIKNVQNENVQILNRIENVQNNNVHLTTELQNVQTQNVQLIEQINSLKFQIEQSKSVQINECTRDDKSVQATTNKNVQSDVQKLSKQEKMYILIEHLIEHYDGVQTDELKPSRIAEDLPLDRVTITRYLNELKVQNKLNGHVNAHTLR